MIVDRPGRSSSLRFRRSTPTAALPRPPLRVGRDRSHDGERWEKSVAVDHDLVSSLLQDFLRRSELTPYTLQQAMPDVMG
jgi:hypothetical protein